MRFRDDRRDSALSEPSGHDRRRHHGTLDMHMNIDQSWDHIAVMALDGLGCFDQVFLLNIDIIEPAVKKIHIRRIKSPEGRIKDLNVSDNKIRFFRASGFHVYLTKV